MSTINIAQIIDAMEGAAAMNTCLLGFTACVAGHPCVMHDLWAESRSKVIETLTKTTLAYLSEKYQNDILTSDK